MQQSSSGLRGSRQDPFAMLNYSWIMNSIAEQSALLPATSTLADYDKLSQIIKRIASSELYALALTAADKNNV